MELGTKAERKEELMKGSVLQVKPVEVQVYEIFLSSMLALKIKRLGLR